MWRYAVEPQFVVVQDGIRTVNAAYASVELAARDDGRAITEALRRRVATVEEIREILDSLTGTSGQAVRRCVLRFSWHHLDDPDYVTAMVRRALAVRAPVSRQNLVP